MDNISRSSIDIIAKHVAHGFPRETMIFMGLPDATIVGALPTELDEVTIRQRFVDIVFRLGDGSLLHLEFQSTANRRDLRRFLDYDLALFDKYSSPIRTVVLYSGSVRKAEDRFDGGAMVYTVSNVFLNEMDGDAVLDTIAEHLSAGEWTPLDRLRLAFAFHMRYRNRTPDEVMDDVIQLIQSLDSPEEQNYVAALILGLSGKSLSDAQNHRLREALQMTDLLKEIVEEAMEKGVAQGMEQGLERGLERGLEQGERSKALDVALKLLAMGLSIPDIAKATGLSEIEVRELSPPN